MQTLARHICALLQHADCVIVPSLGGFIVSRGVSSHVGSVFSPPADRVVFNPSLCEDDGFLAQRVMSDLSLSYADALAEISRAVMQLRVALESSSEVSLDGLGVFRVKQGVLSFVSDKSVLSVSRGYARRSVLFPAIHHASHSLRYAEWVAAVILGILLLSPFPFLSKNVVFYEASLLPVAVEQWTFSSSSQMDTKSLGDEVVPFAQDSVALTPDDDDAVVPSSVLSDPILTSLPILSAEDSSLDTLPSTSSFCVIIASLASDTEASRFLSSIRSYHFPSVEVIPSGNHYRVSVASFPSEPEAEGFRDALAFSDDRFSSAWVFARPASSDD